MYNPIEVHDRSVVILSPSRRGFRVVESGLLIHSGEALSLVDGQSRRLFSDEELQSLMPVVTGSRIPECQWFDFFLDFGADESVAR